MMKFMTTVSLILIPLMFFKCESSNQDTIYDSNQFYFDVTIDPGHGGDDPGAKSSSASLMEKDITLELGKILKSKLENENIKTLLLRENDHFVSLKSRIELVYKSKAQMNITIHLNNSHDRTRTGFTTFYQEHNQKSEILDRLIHEELNQLNLLQDNGSYSGPFYMLSESPIPSVIIDLGYISNSDDVQTITDKTNQITLSESISKAIKRYRNL